MKTGFVLIELLLGFLIAAILSSGLLMTIFQINDLQQTVSTITSIYGRMAILQNQLERDVMGAFIPAQVEMIQTTTVKKDQRKPLSRVFYGTSKGGGQLDVLSFITSNSLEIFFGVKDVKLKPRVARVVYRLVPDERRKGSYILMRQEGTSSLVFDAYKEDARGEFRAYPMIDGIQELSIQYVAIEQQKPGEDKKPVKPVYKKSSKWESEQKQETAAKLPQQQKKAPIKIPNQLQIKISLWDSTYKKPRSFQLIIPVMSKLGQYSKLPQKKAGEKSAKGGETKKKSAEKSDAGKTS